MLRALRLREIGLAALSLLCLAGLLEIAARLLLPPTRYHDAPVEFDARLGFRGIPDYRRELVDARGPYPFELNAQGFRGRPLPSAAADDGTLRIAFLGDSFLVGEAVRAEALLTSRVGAELSARGIDAEIYNLSAIDYGTAQQLLLLETYGPRIRPDVVVLAFFSANDLVNNSMELAGRTIVSRGDPLRPYLVGEAGSLQIRFLHPLLAALRARSRLVTEIERRLLMLGERYQIEFLQSAPAALPVVQRLRAGMAPSEAYEVFRDHDPVHSWESAWRATYRLLREFRDRSRALGARPIVLVIPAHDQVIRSARTVRFDVLARRFAKRSLDAVLDWNLPERRLQSFLRDEGIEAVFLLPSFRAAAATGNRPYAVDEHLAEAGHVIAGQQVAERLSEGSPATGGALDLSSGPLTGWSPVALAQARLDFAFADHRENLGHGWLLWQPESASEGENWGWWTGARALAVLPVGPGDLVVRGRVSAGAALPLRGTLKVVGGRRHPFLLEDYGAFELRVPETEEPWPLSSEGYVALGISPGVSQILNGEPVGFLVREIAFEEARREPSSH